MNKQQAASAKTWQYKVIVQEVLAQSFDVERELQTNDGGEDE